MSFRSTFLVSLLVPLPLHTKWTFSAAVCTTLSLNHHSHPCIITVRVLCTSCTALHPSAIGAWNCSGAVKHQPITFDRRVNQTWDAPFLWLSVPFSTDALDSLVNCVVFLNVMVVVMVLVLIMLVVGHPSKSFREFLCYLNHTGRIQLASVN